MYSALFGVLKKLDPEFTHHWGMRVVRVAGLWPFRGWLRNRTKPNAVLGVSVAGLDFASPVGLAAGFDKNADHTLGTAADGE